MSGTFLTAVSVILMIAYGMNTQTTGIFWRAGLIAALMKAISPSAFLVGPMTSILTEAIIVEIIIGILGKNFIAYLLAGITALYSVIVHKIIALLILYGFNIVRISENFYHFLINQLNIKYLPFIKALFYVSLLYVLIGIASALLGFYTGKSIRKNTGEENFNLTLKKFFIDRKEEKFSVSLIFFHFAAAVLLIYLLKKSLIIAAILTAIYIGFTAFRYKQIFRRLKKVGIWVQLALLFLISAFFYNGFLFLNTQSLLAGAEMILRFFIIIASFSAISAELQNPVIKILLYKHGLEDLYTGLSLAFSVFPVLNENFSVKKFVRQPVKHLAQSLQLANIIKEKFLEAINRRKIVVITGEINSGKTTFLKKIIENLKKEFVVCGIISEAKYYEGKKYSFYVKDIATDTRELLCTRKKIPGSIKTGKFYFSEKGIAFGNKVLTNTGNCRIVVVDEIGPLEKRNQGWAKSLDYLLEKNLPQIWVVRQSILQTILKQYSVRQALILKPEDDPRKAVSKIKEFFFAEKNDIPLPVSIGN